MSRSCGPNSSDLAACLILQGCAVISDCSLHAVSGCQHCSSMEDLNESSRVRSTLKRSRSPEVKLKAMRSASYDDVLTDNMRAQKRYFAQAMATDLDKLNMTGLPNADSAACINHTCSLSYADASMCSSSIGSRDDSCHTATPQSKRQRHLPALEVPDSNFKDSASSLQHRLSESASSYGQRAALQTPRGQRSRDEHDKPPISPNDPCLGMDLRKAALLRSLMLATDPPSRASSIRQGPASNTRYAHRSQRHSMLSACDRMSEGNASTDMDTSMHSDADCSPCTTPSASPDTMRVICLQVAEVAVPHNM